jgi:hypothetical protein
MDVLMQPNLNPLNNILSLILWKSQKLKNFREHMNIKAHGNLNFVTFHQP